jgi:uncharacterized protein YdeI (BOF family)
MKKTLIVIAFAAASLPMFAAHQATGQTAPATNPPAANSTAKPAVKTKKHVKKTSKKVATKNTSATAPVAK